MAGSQRVAPEFSVGFIARRPVPLPVRTLSTVAAAIYTATFDFHFRHAWVANLTGSAASLRLYLVASGEDPEDRNAICKGLIIPAFTTQRLDFIAGPNAGVLIDPGAALWGGATANDTLNIGGWGEETVGA